jgi:hypothetical protein
VEIFSRFDRWETRSLASDRQRRIPDELACLEILPFPPPFPIWIVAGQPDSRNNLPIVEGVS